MEMIQIERERKAAEQWFALPASGAVTTIDRTAWATSPSTNGPRDWLRGTLVEAIALSSCLYGAVHRDQLPIVERTPDLSLGLGHLGGPVVLSYLGERAAQTGLFDVSLNRDPGSALLNLVSEPLRLPNTTPEQESAVAREIREIEDCLQLTRSQIAQALRVERATVYQWFRGAQPRSPRTLERIAQLRQFATAWADAGLGSARSAWYFRRPGTNLTLGDMLTAEHLDSEQLNAFAQQMKQAPTNTEFVEPEGIYGFPAESEAESLRRRHSFFTPAYSENE